MNKKKVIISVLILVIIIVSILFYVKRWRVLNDVTYSLSNEAIEDIPTLPEPQKMYGLIKDSFDIETYRIKRNQNLAGILLNQNIDYSIVNKIAENSKKHFDLRKIRYGNSYSLFFSLDSIKTPLWMVYEIDNTEYLVMQLYDSLEVSRHEKEIFIQRKENVGIITSSLWNTIQEHNLSPTLAVELSEIYAWTVDFFGIEKGDYFKVVYDEAYVDSVSIGVKNIHSSYFYHKGQEYYAFRYLQDSTWSYFDENGKSLRKAFLKAPLKFTRISSRFSNGRFHPVLKIYRPHHGVDYAAPAGTPVYALGDGTITHRAWDNKGGGNYIKIKHNSVYTTVYMHLSGFAKGIHQGKFVRQGELIGYVGKTGLATGPHLDFRVYKNGSAIDPLKIDAPPVEPIDSTKMEEYIEHINPLLKYLDGLIVKTNSNDEEGKPILSEVDE